MNGPMLTGAISKISTQSAGGWKVALDVPEICKGIVKQLIGSENRVVYNITFDAVREIEQEPKRGPGRPVKTEEA